MAVQRFFKASKRNGAIAACACALLAWCWQAGYRSRVAAKSALNAKNLEALGLERLAALLIEISAGNAAAKRRLRMELAGAQSSAELARAVRKRLTIIARSRSFLDWQGARSLAGDLDIQRRAIVETVAKADSTEALDLLWRFMALAPAVLERCDDSSGTVIGVFHEACADIGDVALMAKADPKTLADQAFTALTVNDYGQFDQLIRVLAPSLGQAGLEHLKQRMIDLSNRPVTKPAEKDRVKIGWSSAGPIYADEMAERSRLSTVRRALTEIADAAGDVDAFIEQHEQETRKVPKIAAEIARRLLPAGRTLEAWQTIEAAEHRRRDSGWDWPDFEWEDARIDVFEALGRADDAQAARCLDVPSPCVFATFSASGDEGQRQSTSRSPSTRREENVRRTALAHDSGPVHRNRDLHQQAQRSSQAST